MIAARERSGNVRLNAMREQKPPTPRSTRTLVVLGWMLAILLIVAVAWAWNEWNAIDLYVKSKGRIDGL